jgi:HlyD family secretion protein
MHRPTGRGPVSILRQLWRLLDPPQRRGLLWMQLVGLVMALSTLGGVAAVLPLFTVIADPTSIHKHALLDFLYAHSHLRDPHAFQVALAVGFAALVLTANALNFLGTVAINRYAYSVGAALHTLLFAHYLNSDYAFHLANSPADLASKVLYEVTRLTVGVLTNVLTLAASAATALVIVVSLLLLHPLIACLAIVAIAASYIIIYRLVEQRLVHNGELESEYLARRMSLTTESLEAIKEIIALRTQELFVRRLTRASEIIGRTAVDTLAISLVPRYLLECVVIVGLATTALLLSASGGDGSAWLAELTFVAFAAYRLLGAAQQMFAAMVRIRANAPALDSVSADLAMARARHATADSDSAGEARAPSPWHGRPLRELALHAASFAYAPHRPPAVRSCSLRIPAKAIAGFIGPYGAGKSTTADLLVGLLAPTEGFVTVDDLVLDDSNRRHWMHAVAYVPQHISLIDATIAENIALGWAPQQIDPARLRHAAQLANVDEFVAQLPEGYNQLVGARGVRLSGGQRQRIAVARALYRDASLIVLDEATGALDASAEQHLLAALGQLRGHCTVLVIAHHLSTVRRCDLLFEFDHGQVVASGTYQQMLQQSRRLRALATASA